MRVVDTATGQEIPEVGDIEISMRVGDVVRAKLTVLVPQVDVIAEAEIEHVCQMCKRPLDEIGAPKPEDYRA